MGNFFMRLRYRLVDLLTMMILLGISLGQLGRLDGRLVFVVVALGIVCGTAEVRFLERDQEARSWLRAARICAAYFLPIGLAGLLSGLVLVVVVSALPQFWSDTVTNGALWGLAGAVNLGAFVGLRLMGRPNP